MNPAISVIVPAFNARPTIADCVRALQRQTMRADQYEIIVVDDGSTDDTVGTAQQLNARVVCQPHTGKSAARNCGARAARGDILLYTDADCEPAECWIERMVAPFADPEVFGVKGVYRTRQRELLPRFVQLECEDKYDRMRRLASLDFVDTYAAAYRRETFLLNNGFDTLLLGVEDQEFSFRLSEKGYRLVFAPGAIVYHRHARTLRHYIKRKFEIAYWKALLTRWYPEKSVSDTHTPQVMKLQIGLVALMLAMLPIAIAVPIAAIAALALVLVFALTTIPFVLKGLRRDPAAALASPVFLWFRALALGSGLLVGFVAHRERKDARKPILSATQRIVKRTLDLVLSSILLMICLPLWGIIAVLIKLDSPGPVFFIQQRVGENGRVFKFYKFRTMRNGSESIPVDRIGNGPIGSAPLKLPNDPRVTRIGRLLRRTSLDETPNFINVLSGEMSLVGPRPEEVDIVAQYTDWHRRRLILKPGITGPMQINGRGNLALDQRVSLEIDYIEHYSFWKDLQILAATIPVVISGEGAY